MPESAARRRVRVVELQSERLGAGRQAAPLQLGRYVLPRATKPVERVLNCERAIGEVGASKGEDGTLRDGVVPAAAKGSYDGGDRHRCGGHRYDSVLHGG